jgi:hypothetical protein
VGGFISGAGETAVTCNPPDVRLAVSRGRNPEPWFFAGFPGSCSRFRPGLTRINVSFLEARAIREAAFGRIAFATVNRQE